jgi:hypothetical protein
MHAGCSRLALRPETSTPNPAPRTTTTTIRYAPRAGAALGELTIDLRAVFFPGESEAGVPPTALYLTWFR